MTENQLIQSMRAEIDALRSEVLDLVANLRADWDPETLPPAEYQPASGADGLYQWRIASTGGLGVAVCSGVWRRGNEVLQWTSAYPSADFTLSDGVTVLWAVLQGDVNHEADTYPQAVVVEAHDEAWYTETTPYHKAVRLGTVTVTGGAIVSMVQDWRGGIIDDVGYKCDGDQDHPASGRWNKTLTARGSQYVAELWGASNAADQQAPRLDKTTEAGVDIYTLSWWSPDANKAGTSGYSVEFDGDALQLWNWDSAAGREGGVAAGDLLLVRNSGQVLEYLTVADIVAAAKDDFESTAWDHDHHDHGGLDDDDHGQYWLQGSDAQRNYGTAIGYKDGGGSITEVIDLENLDLEGDWFVNGDLDVGEDLTVTGDVDGDHATFTDVCTDGADGYEWLNTWMAVTNSNLLEFRFFTNPGWDAQAVLTEEGWWNVQSGLQVQSVEVVRQQGAHIPDLDDSGWSISGSDSVDATALDGYLADIVSKINAILAALDTTHGLLAAT